MFHTSLNKLLDEADNGDHIYIEVDDAIVCDDLEKVNIMIKDNKAYPIEYLPDFIKSVAAVFVKIGKSSCNVEKVLNKFLASTIFKEIHDRGNFLYLNKSPRQLLECLTYDEEYNYLKQLPDTSSLYEPDILYWTSEVLIRFQWYYNIDFRDWLKYFSVQDVYGMFYPGHEASYQHMIELLKERYDLQVLSI